MAIILRNCRVCGEQLKTTDTRITLCEKHRGYRTRTKWNRPEILCKVCGKPIPVGSYKHLYCSEECRLAAVKAQIQSRNAKEKRERKHKAFEKLKKELGEEG